jgi:hypothetical protein
MANPFPFVAGNVLTAAELNGIGETTSFTPSWNNVTVGNGTLNDAKYVRVQNLVYVQVTFVLGSTSSVTGNISIAPPVATANGNQNAIGVGLIADVSSGAIFTTTSSLAGGNIQTLPTVASGTYSTTTPASSTVPMTWATGDVITFSATYRTTA